MRVKTVIGAVAMAVIVAIGLCVAFYQNDEADSGKEVGKDAANRRAPVERRVARSRAGMGAEENAAPSQAANDMAEQDTDEVPDSEPEPEMTEEEKKAEEEEKRVDEFDATVDKWMEPREDKTVTMADIDAFRDMFRKVPKDRKEECAQRALNLIPDDNVMLLAGILFDKEQDKEILNLVFNDILNRDEDVKKPILKEIFKDKEHPNWADTAWILDVTGELPANGQDK